MRSWARRTSYLATPVFGGLDGCSVNCKWDQLMSSVRSVGFNGMEKRPGRLQ